LKVGLVFLGEILVMLRTSEPLNVRGLFADAD